MIEEIEFYYHSKNKEHLTNQQWYFHKYNNGTLKNGTYKGLDMTISDNNIIYGGILTRTIKNVTTCKLIIVPCRIVDYMIKKITQLIFQVWLINLMTIIFLMTKFVFT